MAPGLQRVFSLINGLHFEAAYMAKIAKKYVQPLCFLNDTYIDSPPSFVQVLFPWCKQYHTIT